MSKADVERISCPVVRMVGTGEADTFKKQPYACYAALRSPKALRVVLQVAQLRRYVVGARCIRLGPLGT